MNIPFETVLTKVLVAIGARAKLWRLVAIATLRRNMIAELRVGAEDQVRAVGQVRVCFVRLKIGSDSDSPVARLYFVQSDLPQLQPQSWQLNNTGALSMI